MLERTLGLLDRLRDAVAWKYSINIINIRLIDPLIKYPLAMQSS